MKGVQRPQRKSRHSENAGRVLNLRGRLAKTREIRRHCRMSGLARKDILSLSVAERIELMADDREVEIPNEPWSPFAV